jgi:hypothetical protein
MSTKDWFFFNEKNDLHSILEPTTRGKALSVNLTFYYSQKKINFTLKKNMSSVNFLTFRWVLASLTFRSLYQIRCFSVVYSSPAAHCCSPPPHLRANRYQINSARIIYRRGEVNNLPHTDISFFTFILPEMKLKNAFIPTLFAITLWVVSKSTFSKFFLWK